MEVYCAQTAKNYIWNVSEHMNKALLYRDDTYAVQRTMLQHARRQKRRSHRNRCAKEQTRGALRVPV